jgi:hypothetical protein
MGRAGRPWSCNGWCGGGAQRSGGKAGWKIGGKGVSAPLVEQFQCLSIRAPFSPSLFVCVACRIAHSAIIYSSISGPSSSGGGNADVFDILRDKS